MHRIHRSLRTLSCAAAAMTAFTGLAALTACSGGPGSDPTTDGDPVMALCDQLRPDDLEQVFGAPFPGQMHTVVDGQLTCVYTTQDVAAVDPGDPQAGSVLSVIYDPATTQKQFDRNVRQFRHVITRKTRLDREGVSGIVGTFSGVLGFTGALRVGSVGGYIVQYLSDSSVPQRASTLSMARDLLALAADRLSAVPQLTEQDFADDPANICHSVDAAVMNRIRDNLRGAGSWGSSGGGCTWTYAGERVAECKTLSPLGLASGATSAVTVDARVRSALPGGGTQFVSIDAARTAAEDEGSTVTTLDDFDPPAVLINRAFTDPYVVFESQHRTWNVVVYSSAFTPSNRYPTVSAAVLQVGELCAAATH